MTNREQSKAIKEECDRIIARGLARKKFEERLQRAAPRLLAACEAALTLHNDMSSEAWAEVEDEIRAAIAAATGTRP